MSSFFEPLLQKIKVMQFPKCPKGEHFSSLVNEAEISTLEPICCVCRHSEKQSISCAPIVTILKDLNDQQEKARIQGEERVNKFSDRFNIVQKSLEYLCNICNQLSQDTSLSFNNYRKSVNIQINQDAMKRYLEQVTTSESLDKLKENLLKLEPNTFVNQNGERNIYLHKCQEEIASIDNEANLYLESMEKVISKLKVILEEITKWSLLKVQGKIILEKPIEKIEEIIVKTNEIEKIKQIQAESLNNKVLVLNGSQKLAENEHSSLKEFLDKVLKESTQILGVKLQLQDWDEDNFIFPSIPTHNISSLQILNLHLKDWKKNNQKNAFSILQSVKSILPFMSNLSSFSLNISGWNQCDDKSVDIVGVIMHELAAKMTRLINLKIDLSQWNKVTDVSARVLSNGIARISSNISQQLKLFSLKIIGWSLITEEGTQLIVSSLQDIADGTELLNYEADLTGFSKASGKILSQFKEKLSESKKGKNFVVNF